MDNGRIYKVLIIEPSAIVGAGIRTLLDGFSEFRALDAETTGDPATCFERVATTGPDLVLINPALFPVMRRTPIRNAFPMLQTFRLSLSVTELWTMSCCTSSTE